MKKFDIDNINISIANHDPKSDPNELAKLFQDRLEKVVNQWENHQSIEDLYFEEQEKIMQQNSISTSTEGGAATSSYNSPQPFVTSTTPSAARGNTSIPASNSSSIGLSIPNMESNPTSSPNFDSYSESESFISAAPETHSTTATPSFTDSINPYLGISGQQTITIPQGTNENETAGLIDEKLMRKINDKIDEAKKNNDEDLLKYWGKIKNDFNNNAKVENYLNDKKHSRFTKMYNELYPFRLLNDDDLKKMPKSLNVNWGDVSEKMILKLHKLYDNDESEDDNIKRYYKNLINKIKKTKDVKKLFDEHDELFIVLKSIFPNISKEITVYMNKQIYPALSPKNVYPNNIGVDFIYYMWSKTLIKEVLVKGGIGECIKGSDGKYKKLKIWQWYDYDRIDNPTKKDSSFWKAAIYNTEKGNHFYYNTIAQRHAYYLFANAYLNEKKIISQWFEAAAIVTIGSLKEQMNGETALGAAEGLNLWYLSQDTEDFLKEGNHYLFQDNMENVRLLLKGKGHLSGQFTDAKGKVQTFKNLTKLELDLKLVEFEQSLVQKYINSNLDEYDYQKMFSYISTDGVKVLTKSKIIDDTWEYVKDVIDRSPESRKRAIIEEINANFTHWMSPDIMQDILRKHFKIGNSIQFNFANYDDRVKLGQLMVKELYYIAKSDIFKLKSFDSIIKSPSKYNKKSDYFIIDQKNVTSIKENEKHLKDYKFFERIERINNNLAKVPYILENSNEIVETFVNLVLSAIEELVDALIDIAENIIQELEKLYNNLKSDLIEAILKNSKNKYTLQNYLEILKNILEKIYASNEKIKNSTINRLKEIPLNSMGRLMEKTAKQIYPPFNPNWKEEQKINYFKFSYVATIAILLYEFGTGKGPAQRDFDYYEYAIAKAIIKDRMINEIMEETLILLRKTNYDFESKPDSKEFKINLEFSPTPTYALESLDKHLDSNLAQIFIGGAFALVRIRNKKIEGYIYNETSLESLLLHLDIGNVERTGNNDPRLSTIIQRYYFTFKLPKK